MEALGRAESMARRYKTVLALLASGSNGTALAAALLAVAIAVRLGTVAALPGFHGPDENFQFFEQAHRFAFGYGIQPWEFRVGIRSVLLPATFAKLFQWLASLGAGPATYIFAARAVLACLSLSIVLSVYEAGRRISAALLFICFF